MANLSDWVSDKLHEVLGFSDKHTTDYLVSLAKSTTTSTSMVQKISETLGDDNKTLAFARELWDKVPRKQPALHPYRVKEQALIEQQQKFQDYKLLSDDDDDDEETTSSKKGTKRKHIRKKEESSSSDESADDTNYTNKSDDDSEDEWDREEKERMKDREERDAFAQRLKDKDKTKQRNIIERSDKKVWCEKNINDSQ